MRLEKIFLFFILTVVVIPVSVYAQEELSIICPVCRDDWQPLPMLPFVNYDEAKEISVDDIRERTITWNMFGNFDDDLNAIKKYDNPISISTTFFEGDQNKLFSKLSIIKKERIVSLNISLKDYSLTESDMNWLLSLTNLEKLSIRTKSIPRDLPSKLTRLNKLKYIKYSSDGSKESTAIFMKGISQHPTLESLILYNMYFDNEILWSLPIKTRMIHINVSSFSLPLVEKIGNTKSVHHITIINSNFLEKNITIKNNPPLFHSHIRCLEISDEKLSYHILNNIEKFPELKLLAIRVLQKNLAFVKSKISDTKNVVRVLLFCDDPKMRNKFWNDFIKELRFNNAIYVEYYSVWFDHFLEYEQSITSQKTIDISVLNH
jgi:hypothetical protein